MDLGLAGKRALVLGASRGLGGAIAQLLAAEGAQVVAGSRSGTADWAGPDLAARVEPARIDVSDRENLRTGIAALLARAPFDILVLNSGGPPPAAAAATGSDLWDRHFAAMATNLFDAAGLAIPAMRERGWGRIVTIASAGVDQPIPHLAISNTVRASLAGWSKTLATELAPHGITVNVVLPGRIRTARTDELDAAASERTGRPVAAIEAENRAEIPVGRYGTPDEFAAVVAFLASDLASYVTGSKIRVDGGLIRAI